MYEFSDEWHSCIQSWLDGIENECTKTYYRSHIMRFLGTVQSPELVTTADVEKYITQPCMANARNGGAPVKPSSKSTRLAIIRSFYRYAASYRVLKDGKPKPLYEDVNPCATFREKKDDSLPRGMSESEFLRFLQAIDEMPDVRPLMRARDKALFLFAYHSCRRISEILSLTVGDFTYGTYTDSDGLQHEGWYYQFHPSKKRTTQDDRMQIAPSVMQSIQAYWNARPVLLNDLPAFSRIGSPGTESVQCHDPYAGMSITTIGRRMKMYLQFAGLDPAYSPHHLRHGGAQWMYRHHIDILTISHKLRHSSLQVTTTYLKKLQTPVDTSIDQFERSFSALVK